MAGELNAKNVNIYIDDAPARAAYERLSQKADDYNTKIEEGVKKSETLSKAIQKALDAGKSPEKLQGQLDRVNASIDKNKAALEKVTSQQKTLQQQMDSKTGPSLKSQQALVVRLENEYKNLGQNTEEAKKKLEELGKASVVLNQMKERLNAVKKAQNDSGGSSFFGKLASSFKAGGVAASFLGNVLANVLGNAVSYVNGKINSMVSDNAKLSDSLSDIEKATGLSATEVRRLNQELESIDTRTSNEQLREIAIGLGQVGEAANKANVEAIDKIVVALGDEFGGGANEITKELSVLRNNLQDLKTGDYASDVMNIGNALNELGASGLATAPVVTDIANRIAGVAGTFKISSGEILGTAATFQELGISAERGSTAYVTILQKMAQEPAKFAQVAGIPIKEFTNLVNTDMQAAFVAVATGAQRAGKDNVTFSKILKELDADGSGAGEVLSKLGANADILAKKTTLATGALKSNNSILDEFSKKNTNLAAELEKLEKRISSFFTGGAIANFLKGLVKGVNDVIEPTKSATQQFQEMNSKVQNLEKNILPLVNRYDELKGKTNLSKTEQAEMKTIIGQVAAVIPSAITQFDKYGNAIGISTSKAREFITTQSLMLKEKNRDAIKEQQKELAKLQNIAGNLSGNLNVRDKDGDLVKSVYKNGEYKNEKLTPEEIKDLQNRLNNTQSRIVGIKGIIAELNGDQLKAEYDAQQAAAKQAEEERKKREEEERKKNSTITFEDDKKNKKVDQVKKDQEELDKYLKQKAFDLEQFDQTELEKELNRAYQTYQEKQKLAHGNTNALKQLEELYWQEVTQIQTKYGRQELEEMKKRQQERKKNLDEIAKSALDGAQKQLSSISSALKEGGAIADQKRIDALQLKLLQASGKEKLNAQLELLNEEERQALNQQGITEEKKLLVEEQYRQKRKEAEAGYFSQLANEISGYLSQALDIFSQFNQLRNAQEDAELARLQKNNDKSKSAHKRLLDNKLISEQEYNRRVAADEEKLDKKKKEIELKQFERNKKLSIAQALVNGAMAVTKILAEYPKFDFGVSTAIGIAAAIATTAAQVVTISKQKAPEYAKGGYLNGPSHKGGGMPVINPVTGRKEAEVEGGEVILSKNTVRNNAPIVNELLQSSMYRNGATIQPWFKTRPYKSIDYTGLTKSAQRVRYFENGGTWQVGSSSGAFNQSQQPVIVPAMTEQQELLMQAVLQRLQQAPKAYVVYNEFQAVGDKLAQIHEDAIFKKN